MVTAEALNPAVRRVQLGIVLRPLRERAGAKPKEVAPQLGWYVAKVTELGRAMSPSASRRSTG